ncbi:MAG: Rrf2 family transcriptional regulator [Methylobacterium sp. SCN 67-24]|nr:MAG: Rrf2 family transcriptional regulator [Methylobacterium sp. SCN 67-24]
MPRDTRMSRMLHVLIHMDRHVKRATSERIAQMLDTNPVVVRRMMAGFREAGIVISEKGHGGGWELARGLEEITLFDVYRAVGEPALFNIGPDAEEATCLVERAVDARMSETLNEAERLVMARFADIRVADIAGEFETRFAKMKAEGKISDEHVHRWG